MCISVTENKPSPYLFTSKVILTNPSIMKVLFKSSLFIIISDSVLYGNFTISCLWLGIESTGIFILKTLCTWNILHSLFWVVLYSGLFSLCVVRMFGNKTLCSTTTFFICIIKISNVSLAH